MRFSVKLALTGRTGPPVAATQAAVVVLINPTTLGQWQLVQAMTVAIASTTGRYASLFRCLSRREGTRGEGGLLRRSGKCSGKNRREGGRCQDQTPAPCDHSTPLWWRRASGRLRRLIGPRPRLTMGIVAGEATILEVAYRQQSRIRSSRIWVGRATSALLPTATKQPRRVK